MGITIEEKPPVGYSTIKSQKQDDSFQRDDELNHSRAS